MEFLSSIVELAINHNTKDVMDRFLILHGNVCWNAPIWFLLILYLAEILYALIGSYWRRSFTPYVIFMGNIVIWFAIGGYKLPFKLNLLPLALFSFAFGDIFKRICSRNNSQIEKPLLIKVVLCISGLLSILFGAFLNCRISYTGTRFGNFYYCLIAALTGCLFFTMLFKQSKEVGQNRILCSLGKNSMIIMATQYWIFRLFDTLSLNLLGLSVWHGRSTIKAVGCSIITN